MKQQDDDIWFHGITVTVLSYHWSFLTLRCKQFQVFGYINYLRTKFEIYFDSVLLILCLDPQGDLAKKKIYPTLWWVNLNGMADESGASDVGCVQTCVPLSQVVVQWRPPPWADVFCRLCSLGPDSRCHSDCLYAIHEGRTGPDPIYMYTVFFAI